MKDAKNKICDWIEIETQEGSVDKDALAEFILDLVLEEYSQDSAKYRWMVGDDKTEVIKHAM